MRFFRRLYRPSGQQSPISFPASFPLSDVLTETILDTPSDTSDGSQTVALGLPTTQSSALALSIALELGIPSTTSSALALTALNNPIPAVIYDGVGDHLKHTGGPAGATDGTVGTFVWSGTFNSDGSAMTLFDIPGTVPVKLERQSDNTIDFVVGTAGAVCSNSTTAVAASLGFLIVLASFTGTTSHLYVIHAAGTITGTNTAGTGASADLTADWWLGSDGGASNFLDADTAMWWADDSFIDFSVSDNREEFWDTTNDLLRDPGSDGSNPSPAQPLVCHVEASASHTTNRGSGGNADAGTNSGDGTSPGAFADDFTPASAELAFTAVDEDQANASSYTFSAQSIGAAASDRQVLVSFHYETSTTNTVTGVTIGGVTATLVLDNNPGSNSTRSSIWRANVTTGTTADVVVTLTGSAARAGISVHRAVGINTTASDTLTDSGTTLSGSLTIPSGGVALAVAGSTNNTTCTWTNATETADQVMEVSAALSSAINTTDSGATTITATWASTATGDTLTAVAFAAS